MRRLSPMRPRDTNEANRVATSLELFFDLCFVVAVSIAGTQLHDSVTGDDVFTGVTGYLTTFFAVWWAWMNYTWFASAYAVDDWLYRVLTLIQMSGVLVLASGIPKAFEQHDFRIFWLGYIIMRLAMASQWLRAACGDPERRATALRYAAGIMLVQVVWTVVAFTSPTGWLQGFLIGVLLELAVPLIAERSRQTPWHPHHIAERYGLFTLIMMGENVLGTTIAVQQAGARDFSVALIVLAASALIVLFCMWWVYFEPETAEILTSNGRAMAWGYGHYLIFASVGAFGSGIEVEVDHLTGATHLTTKAAALALAIPVALFLLVVWLLHIRPHGFGWTDSIAFITAAALVLVATLTPVPALVMAVAMISLVIVTGVHRRRIEAAAVAV